MASDSVDTKSLNLYQKLAHITGEIGTIKKGGRNVEQGYAFIEYAAVAGELRGLFAKYGIVIVPRMQRASKQERTTILSKAGKGGFHVLIDFYFDVINADKPEEHFIVQWTGEAADYGDKATNKAATSALKYYLMRQFNVSEKGEQDADSSTPEISGTTPAPFGGYPKSASEKQITFIKELAARKGKDEEWITTTLSKVHTNADASLVIDKLQELGDA